MLLSRSQNLYVDALFVSCQPICGRCEFDDAPPIKGTSPENGETLTTDSM
jgi:hypothetical protein